MELLVQAAITKICGVEAALVHPDATLADLGIDSLAASEVLVEIEIQTGRQFPINVLRQLEDATTVRDIIVQLDSVLGTAPSSGA